jgi:hypothetical protein
MRELLVFAPCVGIFPNRDRNGQRRPPAGEELHRSHATFVCIEKSWQAQRSLYRTPYCPGFKRYKCQKSPGIGKERSVQRITQWARKDSNLRRQSHQIYSLTRLSTSVRARFSALPSGARAKIIADIWLLFNGLCRFSGLIADQLDCWRNVGKKSIIHFVDGMGGQWSNPPKLY